MYRNMVTSLILLGEIKTTEAKAKELRRIADKVITLGKRVPLSGLKGLTGDALQDAKAQRVHAIRLARKWVVNRDALDKVFNEFSERYEDRPGGYTRLYKLGFRSGDNAPMNLVQFIPADEELTLKTSKKAPKKVALKKVAPPEEAPAEETVEAAAEEAAPVEEAPAEETVEAAAEEAAPVEEAPVEEAPAEETVEAPAEEEKEKS
jgi:large subunit ribosomal protein L17